MGNTIPTAEEFIKNSGKQICYEDTGWRKYMAIPVEDLPKLFIEFAKLHVQAAIETCIEEAPSGSSTDTVSYEDVEYALKDCYPLENIK